MSHTLPNPLEVLYDILEQVRQIHKDVHSLIHQGETIMATIAELQASIADTNTKVDALLVAVTAEAAEVQAAIQALLDAAAGNPTPAELTAIATSLQSVNDKLSTATTAINDILP